MLREPQIRSTTKSLIIIRREEEKNKRNRKDIVRKILQPLMSSPSFLASKWTSNGIRLKEEVKNDIS